MKKKLCVAIGVFVVASIAHADTVYTSESAWAAAVSGITTVNFEGLVGASSASALGGTPPSTTVGGVTFADGPSAPAGAALFLIGDNFYGFGVATISAQVGTGDTDDLEITLPSSATAVAFDYFLSPGTYTVTLSDGTMETISPTSNPTSGFFGVTDPGGITSLDITDPSSLAALSINVSDFSYATANPVAATPEPRSSILLVALLGAFGLMMQRGRRLAKTIG
jgi:hypothetical protein